MEIKLFEIRDKGTFIPVITVSLDVEEHTEANRFLIRSAGYNLKQRYVLMWGLTGGDMNYNPYQWNNRTRVTAHHYIIENYDSLTSGDVIDVEFILSETDKPKQSELYG